MAVAPGCVSAPCVACTHRNSCAVCRPATAWCGRCSTAGRWATSYWTREPVGEWLHLVSVCVCVHLVHCIQMHTDLLARRHSTSEGANGSSLSTDCSSNPCPPCQVCTGPSSRRRSGSGGFWRAAGHVHCGPHCQPLQVRFVSRGVCLNSAGLHMPCTPAQHLRTPAPAQLRPSPAPALPAGAPTPSSWARCAWLARCSWSCQWLG